MTYITNYFNEGYTCIGSSDDHKFLNIEIIMNNYFIDAFFDSFELHGDEHYQIRRLAEGKFPIPPKGRFYNFRHLKSLLNPIVIDIPLATIDSNFIIKVLNLIINWIAENTLDYWSFHIDSNNSILNVFFALDDDAALFNLCLVNPSYARA